MALTVEQVQKAKDTVWKYVKGGLKALAYIGGGIIVGAACAGVDTGKAGGILKVATGIGMVGLASAAGEVAGNQIEKHIDEAREYTEFGEEAVEKLDQIREKKKAEAAAKAAETATA